jgi:hypothetical protein
MRQRVNRFHHQSWFKISTIVARGVALIAAVLTVPSPVCGKASTFDRNNVACEYAFDGQATTLLRYYVHGATYVDERAMVHEVATGRDYGFALNDMYSVIGLVDDLGHLLEGYHYDVYGTRYAEVVTPYEDLFVAIRNRLGQSAAGQTQYDLNSNGTIDLLDLLAARAAPTVAPIPAEQLLRQKVVEPHGHALGGFLDEVQPPPGEVIRIVVPGFGNVDRLDGVRPAAQRPRRIAGTVVTGREDRKVHPIHVAVHVEVIVVVGMEFLARDLS